MKDIYEQSKEKIVITTAIGINHYENNIFTRMKTLVQARFLYGRTAKQEIQPDQWITWRMID